MIGGRSSNTCGAVLPLACVEAVARIVFIVALRMYKQRRLSLDLSQFDLQVSPDRFRVTPQGGQAHVIGVILNPRDG